MAIKLSDFKKVTYKAGGNTIEIPNLYWSIKTDKVKGRKYLARFRSEDKTISKILGYEKNNKYMELYKEILGYQKDSTNITISPREASKLLDYYKNEENKGFKINDSTSLDELCNEYFESVKSSDWNRKKRQTYNNRIKPLLGKKKLRDIKESSINKIIAKMSNEGLKPRTQKTIIEILKPIFDFAVKNKILKENPAKEITIKIPKQKKVVSNATELFKQVYHGITTYYHDNPYYKALFLFGFTGRRKSEILNLKWENIDFTHNYYWIEDTKSDENQKYALHSYIKDALIEIQDDKHGLVFKSLRPNETKKNKYRVTNIDRQMRQLKKHLALTYCNHNPLYQAYRILITRDKTKEYLENLKWDDKHSKDIQSLLNKYTGTKGEYVFENLVKEKFERLSPHYMRNIQVSALAEHGVEAITLSGILGHTDPNTISKYLSINHHNSSKIGLSKTDEILDVEAVDHE